MSAARALKVWITRAQPGAEVTAARVRALGHAPVVAPVLAVRRLEATALDLHGVEALAFTSRNGVEAFGVRESRRAWPVFAVGAATAEAARAAGFASVDSADGDVAALAGLIAARGVAGVVLHAGASEPAGDLAGALAEARVTLRTAALYETVALEPEVGRVDAVLVHSPKAAGLLAAWWPRGGASPLDHPRVLAISEAAAAPLRRLGAALEIAARPDEGALLALLPEAASLGAGGGGG